MAVTFSGFSGLQMSSYTDTLLVGSQTWALSMFLRVPLDMGEDSAIDNTICMLGLSQNLAPIGQFGFASDRDVFSAGFGSTPDSSKVAFWAGVHGGDTSVSSLIELTRGDPHHIVFGPDMVQGLVQIYLDGTPLKDGVNGALVDELWGRTYTTQIRNDTVPYAIRLGNIDLIATYPDIYTTENTPGPYGATSFSIEDIYLWSDYFPSNTEIIQVKDRRVTPDQVGPVGALKIWWSMSSTSGTPTDGDDNLKNRINPGTFDLVTV